MSKQCEIVQDILPLYVDGVCSKASTEMVKEHLVSCANCNEIYKKMLSHANEDLLHEESKGVIERHEAKEKKKNRKKIIIAVLLSIALCVVTLFISTGFTKNPNVQIINYSVSEDDKELTFTIGIPYSIGYVRGFNDVGGGVKPHYLDFYNTFGVINSSWGAQFEYVLELDEDDTEIYFNRADGGYELVLQKNVDTGEWEKPTN